MLASVFERRLAGEFPEAFHECTVIIEATIESYLGDAAGAFPEQLGF
jgi:hypothetical protein